MVCTPSEREIEISRGQLQIGKTIPTQSDGKLKQGCSWEVFIFDNYPDHTPSWKWKLLVDNLDLFVSQFWHK